MKLFYSWCRLQELFNYKRFIIWWSLYAVYFFLLFLYLKFKLRYLLEDSHLIQRQIQPKTAPELISTSDLHVSNAEELLAINDNNDKLVSLIIKRKISSKSVRTIIRKWNEGTKSKWIISEENKQCLRKCYQSIL